MLGQRILTAVGLVAVLALVLVVLPRDLAVLALGAAGPDGRLGVVAARRVSGAAARAAYVAACAAAMAGLWYATQRVPRTSSAS